MSQRISIDPVSRIPGGCRAEFEVDAGVVRQATVGGRMWRGMESIIAGREIGDVWAYAQRICGACSPAHAIASVRAAESALGSTVAPNAQLIRNMMIAAHAVGENLTLYYHRALPDLASGEAAIDANPERAAALAREIAPATPLTAPALRRLQERLRVDAARAGGSRSFFGALPAVLSELDPEHALVTIGHAFSALDVIRDAGAAMAILAGKLPHVQNLTIGGVSTAIALDDPATLNMTRLSSLTELFDRISLFVDEVFLPDVAAMAARHPEGLRPSAGAALLAFPEFPVDARSSAYELPGGLLVPGAHLQPIDGANIAELLKRIEVTTTNTWSAGEDNGDGAYSWVRTVRLDGRPVEVGPAAQVLVARAAGHGATERWLRELSTMIVARSGPSFDPAVLVSPMGRHLARAVRAANMAELGRKYAGALIESIGRGDLTIRVPVPEDVVDGSGIGIHESPGGALIHEVTVAGGKVSEYRVIAPATWNAGPRAADGGRSPLESALVGVTVRDEKSPVELMRTIHSFAPCMSCATA